MDYLTKELSISYVQDAPFILLRLGTRDMRSRDPTTRVLRLLFYIEIEL